MCAVFLPAVCSLPVSPHLFSWYWFLLQQRDAPEIHQLITSGYNTLVSSPLQWQRVPSCLVMTPVHMFNLNVFVSVFSSICLLLVFFAPVFLYGWTPSYVCVFSSPRVQILSVYLDSLLVDSLQTSPSCLLALLTPII